jgi:hypothetical protein
MTVLRDSSYIESTEQAPDLPTGESAQSHSPTRPKVVGPYTVYAIDVKTGTSIPVGVDVGAEVQFSEEGYRLLRD